MKRKEVVEKRTENSKLYENQDHSFTREIFLEALSARAVQIILLHNHPSGDPRPSREDLEVTRRVQEAGELIGITLTDHIIIGGHSYISFREKNYM